MSTIVKKFFWQWDFDKEEKWLNEMAEKGLCLMSVGFCKYEFLECQPGEYSVRIEFLKKRPTTIESQQYIRFLIETGVEVIGTRGQWIYFKKKAVEGEFELFSDYDSKIEYLKRIMSSLLFFVILYTVLGVNFTIHFILDLINGISFDDAFGLAFLLFLPLSGVLFYKWYKLNRKKKQLEKEKQIFE